MTGWLDRTGRQTERDTRRARIRAAGLRSVKDDAVIRAAMDVRVRGRIDADAAAREGTGAKSLFWLSNKPIRAGQWLSGCNLAVRSGVG